MRVGQFIGKAAADPEYGRTTNGNEYMAIAMQVGNEMGPWIGYLNNEDNIKRTVQSLRYMGWAGTDLGNVTLADLPGYVQVDCRQDVDKDKKPRFAADGTPIGRIAFVNPVTGRSIGEPIDAGARKGIAMRARALVAACPVVQPVTRVPGQGPPPMQGDDAPPDDLPF